MPHHPTLSSIERAERLCRSRGPSWTIGCAVAERCRLVKRLTVARVCLAVMASTMLLTGCGGNNGEHTTATARSEAAAAVYTEVIFDGVDCTVTGSPAPQAGGYAFVLTNTSEYDDAWLFVASVVDGREYQDLIDAQAAVGGAPNSFVHPGWLPHEAVNFDPAQQPKLQLAENQTLIVRTLTPGTDAIGIATEGPDEKLWLCGALQVTG